MSVHRASLSIAVFASSACAQGIIDRDGSQASAAPMQIGADTDTDTDTDTDDRGSSDAMPLGPCPSVSPDVPCFRASLLLGVGYDPRAPSLADVTGDGIDDLVIANAIVGNIQVLARPHWNGFERERVLSTGAPVLSMTTADLDGDGTSEVIAIVRGRQELQIFWGASLDEPASSLPLPGLPVALARRRNGEGLHDHLLVAFDDATLRRIDLFVDPHVGPPIELATPPLAIAPTTAPTNDASAPIFTVDENGRATLVTPAHEVLFVREATAFMAAADITNNGRIDAVLRPLDGPLHLLLAERPESWTRPQPLATSVRAEALTLADLDRDGVDEIVWVDDQRALHVSRWREGELDQHVVLELERIPSALVAGDLDADGWADVVALYPSERSVEILLRRR